MAKTSKSKKNALCQPVLKWVGGKRQLLPEILKYIPNRISTYYEPFIGGGALLFALQPKKAVINDYNPELVNLYNVIKNNHLELIEELGKYKNDADYFYMVRGLDRTEEYQRMSDIQKAARVHYLNKTCYNGLYRVNSAGEFNTPFGGYKNPNITNEVVIKAVHHYFNSNDVTILNGDFADAVQNARRGSFVYFDPPYDPVSSSASFTGYTDGGFGREEQTRLKNLCDVLNQRGVNFLLSNSATDFIKDLYQDYTIEIVKAKRAINSVGDKRGDVDEVLIRNYQVGE